MAQVVPAKFRDRGAFEELRPRRSESGSGFKDTPSTVCLFAPIFEHASRLLIQANVTSLATLRGSAFDGQHLPLEVNAIPTQGQKLAAPRRASSGRRAPTVPHKGDIGPKLRCV
jgi:hypothetical protein